MTALLQPVDANDPRFAACGTLLTPQEDPARFGAQDAELAFAPDDHPRFYVMRLRLHDDQRRQMTNMMPHPNQHRMVGACPPVKETGRGASRHATSLRMLCIARTVLEQLACAASLYAPLVRRGNWSLADCCLVVYTDTGITSSEKNRCLARRIVQLQLESELPSPRHRSNYRIY